MTNSELITIGAFAGLTGLTASALRFYADAGLLLPAEVDAASGYRYYGEQQIGRAILLRRLREIGVPLPAAASILSAERDDAVRLVDEHIDAVVSGATNARQQAAVIKASLSAEALLLSLEVGGPMLAAAVDQILTATTFEPDFAVLNGVHFAVDNGALTLTATDRYRMSVRTLTTAASTPAGWAATVNADDLRGCLNDLRRSPLATLDMTSNSIWVRLKSRSDHQCRLRDEQFPDVSLMLAELPPVTTHVQLAKNDLLTALENGPLDRVSLRMEGTAVLVADGIEKTTLTTIPARIFGPPMEIEFEMSTLYPAVSTAIGADVILDLRAPDQPVTVRSADHGDLTSLIMPTK